MAVRRIIAVVARPTTRKVAATAPLFSKKPFELPFEPLEPVDFGDTAWVTVKTCPLEAVLVMRVYMEGRFIVLDWVVGTAFLKEWVSAR